MTDKVGRPNWIAAKNNVGNQFGTYHFTSSAKSKENDPLAQKEVRHHLSRMYQEFRCRSPLPRIVQVSDHFPDRTGTYYPSCTMIHVCDKDTGCCGPTQICAPKVTHKLDLYFYVTMEVPTLGHGSKIMRIEKLTFYNHTECSCQDRTEELPRDTRPHRTTDSTFQHKCKCPSEYTVRNLGNGTCACDCFDRQRDCTKYKKGRENFNHRDRLCIELGKCTVPSCDFGVYNRRLGRCPRKQEKFRSWARYKI